jgi:hypothetical protein
MKRIFFVIISSLLFFCSYAQEEVLDNQAIIDMVKMGLSDEVIIAKISTDKNTFDTSVSALRVLVDNNVSNAIIEEMVYAKSGNSVQDKPQNAKSISKPQSTNYKRHTENQGVIDMVNSGIDEETIHQEVILSTGSKYDTSLPAILDLQDDGVSERIIQTMMYHSEFDRSLNNQGVIDLVKAGISEEIIHSKVLLATGVKFDMSAEAIKHLKDNGVSSRIIQTMMYHAK